MTITKVNTSVNRAQGYYWVRVKRTKVWIIAKWFSSSWSTCEPFENDTRGGFDKILETRIAFPIQDKPKVKRTRIIPVKIKRTRRL